MSEEVKKVIAEIAAEMRKDGEYLDATLYEGFGGLGVELCERHAKMVERLAAALAEKATPDVEQLISNTRINVRDELRHLMAVHLTENDGESAKAVAAFIHKHWATVYMALAEKGGGE